MAYNRTYWENSPSTETPINADNLNNLEEGVASNDAALSSISDTVRDIENELELADARLDTFTSLPDGSTSANAELTDIRVPAAWDDATYTNAGNAVRGQSQKLYDMVNDASSSFGLSDRMAKGTNSGTAVTGAIIEGAIESNKATAQYAHAEGENTTASGADSHAEGNGTTAGGQRSHAEGSSTTASGPLSHAEGDRTTASGQVSHAEGALTVASGSCSHTEGASTTASGMYSHAEGAGSIAKGQSEHVFGEYNVESAIASSGRSNYIEVVGNGTLSARSNARMLGWNGHEYLADGITLGYGTANQVTLTPAQLSALLALLPQS